MVMPPWMRLNSPLPTQVPSSAATAAPETRPGTRHATSASAASVGAAAPSSGRERGIGPPGATSPGSRISLVAFYNSKLTKHVGGA